MKRHTRARIVRAFLRLHVPCLLSHAESQAMNNSEFDLDAIHQRSFGNEQQLMSTKQAGCFDCLSIFPVVDIKAWVDDKPTRTALCPICSTDSVLAYEGAIPFSQELLQTMHDAYFGFDQDDKEGKSYTSFAEALADYQRQKS